MEVFNRVLCKENIKIEPKFISKSFEIEVKKRLIEKIEGKCTKHGYINHDSVEIYKIAPGIVELISLSGHIIYTVYFYADVCNPALGSIIKATISNINRFGILAEAGYNYKKKETYIQVLEIIIAKNSVNIQSDIDLETLKIGDEVKLEIIGKKFKLGESKMSAIGRIVKEKETNKSNNKKIEITGENEDEDEEAYEEKSDNDEEEEDDEEEEEEEEDEDDEEDEEDLGKHGGSDFFTDDENFFSDEEEVDVEEVDEDFDDDKDLSSDFDDNED
jgi:DNA-directed RNA polymerase subunit E'/Rpb7